MKVIIVGKGMGWEKAPGLVSEGEVWGVNNVCLRRHVDLVFNIHDLDKHKNHPLFNRTIDHVNRCKIPIITQKVYKHIPTSIEFPLEHFYRPYFTNSIDYMVAYAWYRKDVSSIDMYGVVMSVGTEYSIQRPSLEYWVGVFEGDGGVVVIHKPSCVCELPRGLYGYDWDEENELHVLAREENK
jgi:hypothetical protein